MIFSAPIRADRPLGTAELPAEERLRAVYLAAGAGGMICGSCLHDNALARALTQLGHEVLLVPTYTPLKTDEPGMSLPRVFLGGVNVYLQQHLALFRHTPAFLDRLLDSPALLRWASSRAGSTRAEDLGPMTVSMLAGREGRQRKEIDKLVDWLAAEVQPQVVHLSNSMLVGLAEPISRRLGVPVVCTLSGEDIFLEKLPEPHYSEARRLLRAQARAVSSFVALNQYFAGFMADYLSVPREQIAVIPHGLEIDRFPVRRDPGPGEPRRIGYLARVCPEKGLHQLVDAAVRLAARTDLPAWTIEAAGYLGPVDRPYLAAIQNHLADAGLGDRFTYHGELSHAEKLAFLESLYLMSLPTVYHESKGLSALESLAAGVPVVLPDHGAFPELVADTGGGVLHAAGSGAALAEALAGLLVDPDRAALLGRAGRAAMAQRYTARLMAERTAELYRQVRRR